MPKTKKSTKSVSKSVKSASKKRVSLPLKSPHMTKTLFGASYLLILAVLSLLLITISSQLPR